MKKHIKLCKYYKRKVVKLNRPFLNCGGDVFHRDEFMIIRRKGKDGLFELARPLGCINIMNATSEDFTVIGDEKDILKKEKQNATESNN